MAYKAKEVVVQLKNTPGAGAEVFAALAEAKVNMDAMVGYKESARKAAVHFIPSDFAKAKQVLKKAGFKAAAIDVVVVEMPNKAGSLAEVSAKLAAKKINIHYAYATAATKGKVVVVLTFQHSGN